MSRWLSALAVCLIAGCGFVRGADARSLVQFSDQPYYDYVATDGRYAALHVGDNTRVIDTKSGVGFEVPTPVVREEFPDCIGSTTIGAVGAGHLVWNCSNGGALMLDLATRQISEPPGYHAFLALHSDVFGIGWNAVGSEWLAGYENQGPHATSFTSRDAFFNWHTGRVLRNVPRSAHAFADVDRPALVHRLCRPLSRTRRKQDPNGDWVRPPFFPYPVALPYALRIGKHLMLERCGQRHPRRLSAAPPIDPTLGFGYATWGVQKTPTRATAVAYSLRTHRTYRYAVPASSIVSVSHTGSRLFVGTHGPPAIWTAPLPR